MDEKLKDAKTKAKDFWNKYDKKQKRLIISIIGVVIVAVIILSVTLSVPEYEVLVQCEDSVSAADIADVLTSNSIPYTTEDKGLTIKVEKEQLVQATYLIAQEGYTAQGYEIEDYVEDGGFSTTSEDKERLYQKYLEDKMVSVLTSFDCVRNAYVTFSIPTDTYTVLKTDEEQETFVSVQLALKDRSAMTTEIATGMAKYCATAVGNDTPARVTIIDTDGNTWYHGDNENCANSMIGASEKDKIRQVYYDQMVSNVTQLLTTTNLYSTVTVAPSLKITFDKVDIVDTQYSNEEDVKMSDYIYDQQGGSYSGGIPGTDSNDDDSDYMIDSGDGSNTSISISKNEYAPSSTITHTEGDMGVLDKEDSTISVMVNKYEVYDEGVLEEAGELDDITWAEYRAEHGEVVAMEADFTGITLAIAHGTGIPVENIYVEGYVVPVFNDKVADDTFTTRYLPIIIGVIIVLLLLFVVWRSLRPVEVAETEPELSVDEMLKATKDKEVVEDIEYDDKSEVRKVIEKFVDENPESVALLLRTWMNRDWE